MDEKTEQLRDIFIEVADEDTVTERQEESPGTLSGGSDERRVYDIIERMRDRYPFRTDVANEGLYRVATAFYDDEDDETIAAELGTDEETITLARLDLHLLNDDDREFSFDLEVVRNGLNEDRSVEEIAEELDADVVSVDRARAVVEAENEMRRASYRFRDEFDALLADGDLSQRLTESAKEDGLDDATEGIETNTSF